jgi:hypothetical protein
MTDNQPTESEPVESSPANDEPSAPSEPSQAPPIEDLDNYLTRSRDHPDGETR